MNSCASVRRVLSLAGTALAFHATTFAAAPKVEETVVGPTNAGGIYTLSPHGGHIAYMGLKGTRVFVSVDGIEGPVFDELYGPTGQSFFAPQQASAMLSSTGGLNGNPLVPVLFSPDGAHYAYAARKGTEYVVIHDGVEIAHGPREALTLDYGPLTLSPTGRYVYWDEMKRDGGNGSWRLMMSGKPGPWSGHQTIAPVFSPDDSHYAYNFGKVGNYREQVLLVDGKEAGYAARDLVFTADGKSLLAIGYGAKTSVLVDGKPAVTGISVDKIIPSPAGHHWGAIVRTKLVNSMGVSTFFLDGKEISGTDGAQAAWFSADGKHYAVSCVNEAARSGFMVIDGKAGNEYQSVSTQAVYWTPDGSKTLYTVTSGGRNFMIVNGEEFPITSLMSYNPIAMPEVGGRYSFSTRDGSNRIFTLVLDGKSVLPAGVYPIDNTFTFSPDGSRYAYTFGPVGRSEITGIAIDGVVQPGLAPEYFRKWVQMQLVEPSFVFSRDAKHVAYVAHGADPKSRGLYLDGKLVFPGPHPVYFARFTPDNQHFFWVVEEAARVPGQPSSIVVYVDGRDAVRAHGYFFSNSPGTWEMDAKGIATFFAADGDVVKRYRITPAADTNVASIISAAAEAEAKALADAEAAKKAQEEAAAKKKADQEAAAAKAKADYAAAVAAKAKARQDAIEARQKAAADAAAARAKARNKP